MSNSLYIKHFESSRERVREQIELSGDLLMVEQVELPELKTASGIFLVETKNQQGVLNDAKPLFFRVLQVGEGYYDDVTKEPVPLTSKQGDIIVTGLASVKLFAMLPGVKRYKPFSIGLTRESDILLRFKGEASFEQFLKELDTGIQSGNQEKEV